MSGGTGTSELEERLCPVDNVTLIKVFKDDEDRFDNREDEVIINKELEDGTIESDNILIDTIGLPDNKKNQVKRLKRLVKVTYAYCVFYYQMALIWKRIYWTGIFTTVILSSLSVCIGIFLDPCSSSSTTRGINILIGAIITAIIGLIGAMNPSLRNKEHEDAGDDYKNLSEEIYREVFFSNSSFENMDLAQKIEKFSIKFDAYTKIFKEPGLNDIEKIIKTNDAIKSFNL